jgi:hypothetical protein
VSLKAPLDERGPLDETSTKSTLFGPGWPLKFLLLGIPFWWAFGIGSFIFLITAVVMAVDMYRRGRIRLPAGFGVWLLFLLWMTFGVFMLWVHAPGTVEGGGPGRLVGYGLRYGWYLAITVAMLYPLSFSSRVLPGMRVVRWLGMFFLYVAGLGLLGVLLPKLEFTSPMELIVPGASSEGFVRNLVHPSLTTFSDFLGYEQPRPKAPFAYPNAWGNNFGLLLPFFVLAWTTSKRHWQRVAVPFVLALALIPVVFSLNRGLWIGLTILAIYAAVNSARSRHYAGLLGLAGAAVLAIIVITATPLADTIALRVETPHSNDRRTTVAETVTSTTWEGSPLLGYGTTRQVQGSFGSITGGATPDCHQCAAPPMGTQGFVWRLVFTTGFVGTILFYLFLAIQMLRHIRRRDGISVVGCMALTVSLVSFMVYDSLESPLFILMLAVGLMNRQRLEAQDHELPVSRPTPTLPAAGVS